jgi:hypothetical protein
MGDAGGTNRKKDVYEVVEGLDDGPWLPVGAA